MDAVLIVGAGPLQVPMIQEAQAMGLAAIVTDANPDAPGVVLADMFFPVDTYDVPGHRLLAQMLLEEKRWTMRGVVTCGADVAPSVAVAAQVLGCRGISLEVATRTHNKFQVRRMLSEAGLDWYQPRVSHVEKYAYDQWMERARLVDADTVWEQIQQSYQIPLPWVVKPLEQRASRGVTIVQQHEEYLLALDRMLLYGSECLVEEQLQGTEHSAEIVLGEEGAVLWWNIVDRYFDYRSGVPLETGHVNPTRLDAHAQQQLLSMALATSKALGVTWGPYKMDCMMTATGPKLLECTARLSGGWDSQWSSPATGRHPMRLLLQLACGLPLEAQPAMAKAKGYAAVAAIMPRQWGRLTALQLPLWGQRVPLERLRNHDQGVIYLPLAVGDMVPAMVHNAHRAGFVMASSQDYDRAWETVTTIAQEVLTGMQIDPSTNLP